MFHLLPEKEKRALKREYNIRLAIISLVFIFATLVIAMVFLLPSFLLSNTKLADVNARNKSVKAEIVGKEDPALTTFLSSLSDNLNALGSVKSDFFSTTTSKIINQKITGIRLNQINIDENSIVLGGVADSRENLFAYSNQLKTVPGFKNVDLPISDLAKNKDISFSINISLK